MTTTSIQFMDDTFALSAVSAKGNDKVIDAMKGPELVTLYNLIAENIDVKTIKKFADHKTAVKRTWAMLEAYAAWASAEKEAAPAPKKAAPATAERKKREMHFVFAPENDGIKTVKNEKSLRGRAVSLLVNGATFDQVKKLVTSFDTERGKGNAETLERRAYELVRIMHYYLGYGIKQDDEGVITIYTK